MTPRLLVIIAIAAVLVGIALGLIDGLVFNAPDTVN